MCTCILQRPVCHCNTVCPLLQYALHHCNRSSAPLQPFHPSPSTIATLLTCVHLHLATSCPSLQHIFHARSVRRCSATHPATASLRFSCNAPHAPTCTIHSSVLSRLSSKYIKATPSNARLRSQALESGNGNSAASSDQATRGVHEDSRRENTLEDQMIQRRIALCKSHRFMRIRRQRALRCRGTGLRRPTWLAIRRGIQREFRPRGARTRVRNRR